MVAEPEKPRRRPLPHDHVAHDPGSNDSNMGKLAIAAAVGIGLGCVVANPRCEHGVDKKPAEKQVDGPNR
jgi:hypothetical protein